MDWNQSLYLDPEVYPITQLEAAQVLRQAWITLLGYEPSINSLAILFAQFGLETGYGKYCKNACFGNIKSSPNDGYNWTMFRCNEIIGGKEVWFDPPSPYCRFRAFKNNQDGATNYVAFVSQKTRYKKAWQEVINGNPQAYAIELHNAGYYTASVDLYTKGVVSIFNQFKNKYGSIDLSTHASPPNDTPIETFTPDEIAQIKGQLGLSMDASIQDYFKSSRTDEDESEFANIDPTDNTYYTEVPSLWSKVKGVFGGKK